MVATINVVVSDDCDACRMCKQLLNKVRLNYPEVEVVLHNVKDPQIRKFMEKNLTKPVSTIQDEQMRQHYEAQGIKNLSGLPTMYITTTKRPMRIMDSDIGSVGSDSSMDAREHMNEELHKRFKRAMAYDVMFGIERIGRMNKRRDEYGY